MSLSTRLVDRRFPDSVLVMYLEGWIDAGVGAATAMAALLATGPNEPVVRFDSDALLDHRARRPVMRIVDGVNTGLTWPQIEIRSGHDEAGQDVLYLVGPEPDLLWGAFTAEVVSVSSQLGVRLAVGLGAFPAPVPHTRPVRLAATSTAPELAHQIGYVPGTLDVPAGIHAALEVAFGAEGVPAVGLWARVPHYASAMPFPAASAALIDGLAGVAGLQLDTQDLRASAERTRLKIDELIANSEEHRQLVAQLEAQIEAEEPGPAGGLGGPLPSGEELAAELERFLRGESGG